MKVPTLSFIGCGKLGQTLGRLFADHGVFQIKQVLTRQLLSAEEAVLFIGAGTAIANFTELQTADVFILALPDAQIATVAQQLATTGLLSPASTVFHCSGALSSNVLAPCAALDAATASAHPLLSFADPAYVAVHFADANCHCAIEGAPRAVELLTDAFTRIGAQPFILTSEAKLRYHAAAVIASNYLVTLTEQALLAMESAGVARELGTQLLLPLMKQTLDNLAELPPAQALTGPVARGDMDLVRRQHADLAATVPAVADIYATLANATAKLAKQTPPFGKPG